VKFTIQYDVLVKILAQHNTIFAQIRGQKLTKMDYFCGKSCEEIHSNCYIVALTDMAVYLNCDQRQLIIMTSEEY